MIDELFIRAAFPKLGSDFSISSPQTRRYNCIAWAAGETHRQWWPDAMKTQYWPKMVPREPTVDAFIKAFESLGYSICNDGTSEINFEKIAFFTRPAGTPAHAAREIGNGKWTSKLGDEHDIEHNLEGVEGTTYGKVKTFMKRPRQATPPKTSNSPRS